MTGSSGLIGSEAVTYFEARGWSVHGLDNNQRLQFFGPHGDTTWNLNRLKERTQDFHHHDLSVTDRPSVLSLVEELKASAIVHCAAQPSHDLASSIPFEDFEVNAVGTLNLLEAARRFCPESPFVFLSTNKVYGDGPNRLKLVESETRFDFGDEKFKDGISEDFPIDESLHSLFGASKLAADIMVQEYGRYFGMPTVCFRGGCLTGPNHSSAELHGFLAYLARCFRLGESYRIFGYGGKQVRDNIHAFDVCTAIEEFINRPRVGAVYNLGGGRSNSTSVLEAIESFESIFGRSIDVEYVDQPRVGDHICYITNLSRLKSDFPEWNLTRDLATIFEELAAPLD